MESDFSQSLLFLLEDLLERLENDPSTDPESFYEAHPAHAGELRSMVLKLGLHGLVPIAPEAGAAAQVPELSASPDDRYELGIELGSGGMGVVYRVFDRNLGRWVAMKQVKASPGRGKNELLRRFYRETRITSCLQHPNIVPVHDIGIMGNGTPFFTMKVVAGETFEERIRNEQSSKHQTQPRVEVVRRVCEAISFAHSEGIVHRDLKPRNVMVGQFGEVQVMDWGLAKELESSAILAGPGDPEEERSAAAVDAAGVVHSATGDVLGTLSHISPEQARGDGAAIDVRTDVFGLGAMLFHALTGRAPYEGSGKAELLKRATRGEANWKALAKARVPEELKSVCRKAMSCDSGERYATPEELMSDLSAFLHDLPGEAWKASESPLRKSSRFVRKHPLASTVALALAALTTITSLLGSELRASELNRATLQMANQRSRFDADLIRIQRNEGNSLNIVDHSRRFRGGANELLDILAAWELPLDGSVPPEMLAERLNGEELEVARERLIVAIYELGRQLSLSGIPVASNVQRFGTVIEGETDFGWMAAEYPRLVTAWSTVIALLDSQEGHEIGAASLRAMEDCLVSDARDFELSEDQLSSASPEALVTYARYLVQAKRDRESASVIDEALSRSTKLVWAHYMRGREALTRGALDEALFSFTMAYGQSPDSVSFCMNLAATLEDLGRIDEAIEVYQEFIGRWPDYGYAHHNLSLLLIKQGNLDQAIAASRRATEADLEDPDVTFTLAGHLEFKALEAQLDGYGDESDAAAAEAIDLLRGLAAADPEDGMLRYRIGLITQMMGDHRGATAEFDRALELGYDDLVHHNKAESLWLLGELDAAFDLLEPHIQEGDTDAYDLLETLIGLMEQGPAQASSRQRLEALR